MRIIASLGMYLTGNTFYVAVTTIFAAGLNILLNFIFIPKYGMMAAAYSTLIAFVVLYLSSYFYSDKQYKIPYENLKIFEVLAAGVVFYILAQLIPANFFIGMLIKLFAFLLLPLVLFIFNFYEKIELQRLNSFYKKWQNPLKWRENLKIELKDFFKS